MADPSETVADEATDAAEPADATPSPRSGARSLDRRTIAIAAMIGLVAALLTALIASTLLSDDDNGGMELKDASGIDTNQLLSLPVDTVDGGTSKLGAFLEDQPMLVNFWASNCVPCLTEMPWLEQASKDNPNVSFVGVATLDQVDQAKKLAKQTGVTYPWVLDPTGEVAYEGQGTSLPTTLLLSADGDVIASHVAKFDSMDEVQAFVDQAG